MLLRAYRLTDKLSLLVLKTLAAVGEMLADGFMVLFGTAGEEKRGLIGIIARVLNVLAKIFMLLLSGLIAILSVFFGAARRVGGGAVQAAAGGTGRSVGGAMARRAARAQMDAGIAEDPLRQQNRVLSAMFVITLLALIVIVLYATRPQTQNVAPLVASGGNFGLNDSGATEEPAASSFAIATAIPTATLLPEALQARGSVAFTVRENGQTDLWVAGVATGRNPIRLTNDEGDERDAVWSPDGRRLAYASNQDGNWDIYVYDTITNTTERKTLDLSFQGAPSWSPDGIWLTYESYAGNNLDIFVLAVDGSVDPQRLPGSSDMPDFSPAWSADGRHIAFTSWMDGASQDIYVFSLDTQETINLTRTPDRNEDFAAWFPDSQNSGLIAYSAVDAGIEKIFVKSIEDLDAPAQVIGVGREPSWSPDGVSIIAAVDTLNATHLTVYPYSSEGIPLIISAPQNATSPVWTRQPLPAALLNSGGLPLTADRLYNEQVQRAGAPPYYRVVSIGDVDVASDYGVLNDQVNDSFVALRERMLALAGWDFLGRLDDAWWDWEFRPQPGEEVCNWHLTGRAFSMTQSYAQTGFPPPVEVVREDNSFGTFWRLFVRVTDEAQFGQLGEPLRKIPWDFNARNSGDVQAYEQGGKLRAQVPEGYYVDFTQIAEDFGWQPYPAGNDWRLNINAINYWMFYKPDGLSWVDAMRELYLDDQLGGCLPATPVPVVTPAGESPSVTEEAP
jgi:TolB protein